MSSSFHYAQVPGASVGGVPRGQKNDCDTPEFGRTESMRNSKVTLVPKQVRRVHNNKLGLYIFCISLHVVFIAFHVFLVVAGIFGLEHRISTARAESNDQWFQNSNVLALVASLTTQTIGTGYATLLVAVTQQLALRKDLHTPQTLTAIHEKADAWMGTLSSLSALFRQVKKRRAGWRVSLITLYLFCILAVHITTSTLLDVVPYSVRVPQTFNTNHSRAAENDTNAHQTYARYILNTILMNNDNFTKVTTIGLQNNIVYDVIPVVNLTGTANVSAVVFDADCKYIQAQQQGEADYRPSIYSEDSMVLSHYFQLDDSLEETGVPLGYDTVSMLVVTAKSRQNHSTIFIATTAPVFDDANKTDFRTPISPSVAYIGSIGNGLPNRTSVQIMGCDIHARNVTMAVDVRTREPVDGSILPQSQTNGTHWQPWTLSKPPQDNILSWVFTLQYNQFYQDQDTWVAGVGGSGNISTIWPVYNLDLFLTRYVAERPERYLTQDVNLSTLNSGISKMMAAMYWTSVNLVWSNSTYQGPFGKTVIYEDVFRSRLQINRVPASIGTALAVILLGLAYLMIHPDTTTSIHTLDAPGVLQVSWLTANSPKVVKAMEYLSPPETENLLDAGEVMVDLSAIGDGSGEK